MVSMSGTQFYILKFFPTAHRIMRIHFPNCVQLSARGRKPERCVEKTGAGIYAHLQVWDHLRKRLLVSLTSTLWCTTWYFPVTPRTMKLVSMGLEGTQLLLHPDRCVLQLAPCAHLYPPACFASLAHTCNSPCTTERVCVCVCVSICACVSMSQSSCLACLPQFAENEKCLRCPWGPSANDWCEG